MTIRTMLFTAAAACALGFGAPIAIADGGGMGGGGMSAGGGSEREDPARAYQQGVAALQASDYRAAIRHFRVARRAAPRDGAINFALGLAYVGADENEDARTALERAVAADNPPAGAYSQLGLVHLELGDRAGAEEQRAALIAAITACDDACGATRRAQLEAALAQLAQALDAPASADPATTGWDFPGVEQGRTAYAEAVGLVHQARYADAFDRLTEAQAAVGPHPDVLNYLGFVSRRLGRYDAALAYYSEALRIDPTHLGATEYLGELYIQMGDLAAAEMQLARLDQLCAYGCAQREELARWISTAGH